MFSKFGPGTGEKIGRTQRGSGAWVELTCFKTLFPIRAVGGQIAFFPAPSLACCPTHWMSNRERAGARHTALRKHSHLVLTKNNANRADAKQARVHFNAHPHRLSGKHACKQLSAYILRGVSSWISLHRFPCKSLCTPLHPFLLDQCSPAVTVEWAGRGSSERPAGPTEAQKH